MLWGKLIGAGVLALIAAGASLWLILTVQENERLTINNLTLEEARKSDQAVIDFLREDNAAKEAAIKLRTAKIGEMNARLLKAKDEVKVITKTIVTEVERECLLQPVPNAVVDFMLDRSEASTHEGNS
jgi:hypothetical protein